MRQFIRLLIVCVFPFVLYHCIAVQPIVDDAKKSKYAYLYQDKLEPGSILIKAWYHYSLEKTASGAVL